MAKKKLREYTGEAINVTFDVRRCIHSQECVKGLPAVFDTDKRPWVQPDQADADKVAEVVMRCPTGALHYQRNDEGVAEPIPSENRVKMVTDGPLYVRGDLHITDVQGSEMRDVRAALCRCGASGNKPFCDNSHLDTQFEASGTIDPDKVQIKDVNADGGMTLMVNPTTNGPLVLAGSFEIQDSEGKTVFKGDKAALCRCGASGNKPFCDGTHAKISFTTEEETDAE